MGNNLKAFSKAFGWLLLFFVFQAIGLVAAVFGLIGLGVFNQSLWMEMMQILETDPDFLTALSSNPEVMEIVSTMTYWSLIISAIPWFFFLISMIKKEKTHLRPIKLENVAQLTSISVGTNLVISVIIAIFLIFFPDTYNMSALTSGNSILMLISVGILGPISEEIIFRGCIYNSFLNHFSVKKSIVCQALMFGLVHGNVYQVVYTALFGMFMCSCYEASNRNLAVPIVMHIALNTSSVIATVLGVNEFLSMGVMLVISLIILLISHKKTKNIEV